MGKIVVFLILGVIAVVLAVFAIWFIIATNKIKAARLKVEEAGSGIDVALTKRYDVLTKQLAVVKEYTSHESKTLFETIKLRSGMALTEKIEVSNKMDEVATQFRLTAEAYPELKSSANYAELQKAISDVEEHLQAARRLYNANVTAYNTIIAMFPTSLAANAIGAEKRDLFQAEEHKRNDVEMKF